MIVEEFRCVKILDGACRLD